MGKSAKEYLCVDIFVRRAQVLRKFVNIEIFIWI